MKKNYISRTGQLYSTPTANTQRMGNPFAKFIAIVFITLAALMSGMKGWGQTAAQYTMAATSHASYTVLSGAASVTASAADGGYFKGIKCKLFY